MSTKQEKLPLDYRSPAATADVDNAGVCTFLFVSAGIVISITVWWQLGIRFAQRQVGFDLLEPYAAGTGAWMTWCVDAPFIALVVALASLGALSLVLAFQGIWSWRVLTMLPLLVFLFIATIVINLPLIRTATD